MSSGNIVVEDFLASKMPNTDRKSLEFKNELSVFLKACRMCGIKFAIDFSKGTPSRKASMSELETAWSDWMDKAR